MTLVNVRGVDVDLRFVILNCVWDVTLIFVWVAVIVTTRRLYSRLSRHNKSPEVYESQLTRWSHIFVISILCTLYGIDTMNVYFDRILFMNVILMQEYCIIATSWVIYYLLSHVQTYLVLHSVVTLPEWLIALRRYWMRFVLIAGNILVIVVASLRRAFLEGLVFQFLAVQHMILGPVLAFLVCTVSRQWKELYAEASPQSGKLKDAMRSFQRFGYVSSGFIMFFGAALTYFYAQDFAVPKDVRFEDLPGYGNRHGADMFSLRNAWPRWFALVALLYLLKLHWIAKRPEESTDRDKTPSGPVVERKAINQETCFSSPSLQVTSKFTEETGQSSYSRISLHDLPYHAASLSNLSTALPLSIPEVPPLEKFTLDSNICSLKSLPEEVSETIMLGSSPSTDAVHDTRVHKSKPSAFVTDGQAQVIERTLSIDNCDTNDILATDTNVTSHEHHPQPSERSLSQSISSCLGSDPGDVLHIV